MSILLAVDTSTARLGLALYDGTQVLAESLWVSRARHTVELAPALNELLGRTGISIHEIRAVGVALGPGSFTSLRVGLAFIKGLALARHLPVVGIPSLEVVAAPIPPADRELAAVIPAGRGRLAVGWFRPAGTGWQAQGAATAMSAEELENSIHTPTIICGELTASDRQTLARKYKNVTLASPAQCLRRPGVLAELAWRKWQANETDPVATLAPIYLHVAGGLPA